MVTHRQNNVAHNSSLAGKICKEKDKNEDASASIQYFEFSSEYNELSEDLQIDTITLNKFFSILRDTSGDINLRSILDRLLITCINYFKADRGAILLHCNNNSEFELKAARDNENNNLLSFPISKTIIQILIEKRNSLFFPDFLENNSISSTPGLINSDRHSILCAPLKKKTPERNQGNFSTDITELLGIIYLESKAKTGTVNFTKSKLIFLQVLADQAATAINNALYNEFLKESIEKMEDRINLRNKELADSNRQLSLDRKNIVELNKELKKWIKNSTKNDKINENHKDEFSNITAETLHNVKNILNSIKVSSELVEKLLIGKAYRAFCQANEMLRKNMDCLEDFICNNPKGKKLMQYYLKLEEIFRDESKESTKHIDRLRENVSIINDIISAQQLYSKGTLLEVISLSKVIEDAIIIQSSTLSNFKIKVVKNYSELPAISIQKTKFMHVLINLIKNAKEAMIDTPVENRILRFEYGENDNIIQLKISDRGYGISGKNIKQLFSYGFTTKKGGNGYGLHSCRAYMKEMGGNITAFSEGEGKGATFTIELIRSNNK